MECSFYLQPEAIVKKTALILSMFLTTSFVFSGSAQENNELSFRASDNYLASHQADSLPWWLTGTGSDSLLEKKILEVNDFIGVFKERVPPSTPLADFIKTTRIRFGYIIGDSAYFPAIRNNGDETSGLSICFIPRIDKSRRPFISYSPKEKRLSFWGIKCPETVFDALFFYGLELAATEVQKKNSVSDRERLMIPASILNDAGRGDFFSYLDSLLNGLPTMEPLAKISADDLKKIDSRLGIKTLDQEIAKEIIPVYTAALNSRLMLKRFRQR